MVCQNTTYPPTYPSTHLPTHLPAVSSKKRVIAGKWATIAEFKSSNANSTNDLEATELAGIPRLETVSRTHDVNSKKECDESVITF